MNDLSLFSTGNYVFDIIGIANKRIKYIFVKKITLDKKTTLDNRKFNKGKTVYEIDLIDRSNMKYFRTEYWTKVKIRRMLRCGLRIAGLCLGSFGKIIVNSKIDCDNDYRCIGKTKVKGKTMYELQVTIYTNTTIDDEGIWHYDKHKEKVLFTTEEVKGILKQNIFIYQAYLDSIGHLVTPFVSRFDILNYTWTSQVDR